MEGDEMRALILALTAASTLAPLSWGEVWTVFVFGKVEVLKSGSGEWRFLRSGDRLSDDDLIRMPPGSILRLREDGRMLPVITGSREQRISELVALAKERMMRMRSKRFVSNGAVAVDALPTGSRSPAPEEKVSTEVYTLSPEEVARIEGIVEGLVRAWGDRVVGLLPSPFEATLAYPPPALLRASSIFDMLFDGGRYPRLAEPVRKALGVELPAPVEKLIVYRFALGCTGVRARLKSTEDGIPYLLLGTGLAPDQRLRITANSRLVVSNGELFIPLRIKPDTSNFVHAWYSGAELRL